METILVGAIVLAAAAYTVYRLFVRRDCGCGRGRACENSGKRNGQSGACRSLSSGNGDSEDGSACGRKK
ncbi:MAG: hypothetical protein LBP61_09300 [Desulfovibrio sp.]|jgi:hypothetical protein|nr:hypothetical protein [Desulfovibrio sp.]